MVSSLSELIALLVQSFNLSALLPSFLFVLFNYVFVRPYLRELPFYQTFVSNDPALPVLILITVTVALGYLLNAANTQFVRWFEGYPLLDQYPLNQWRTGHMKRIQYLQKEIDNLEESQAELKRRAQASPTGSDERDEFWRQYSDRDAVRITLLGERLFHYPQDSRKALPTKLGNIIASAEEYPELLFGIDSVLMWPYIVPTLTKSGYAKYMEREKSIFDLLLNSTLLITVFGIEVGYLGLALQQISFQWGMALLLIAIAVGLLFYLTTDSVMGWALTFRAAFLLHRHSLSDALGLRRPVSFEDERALWKRVSQLYREPNQAQELAEGTPLFAYPPPSRPIHLGKAVRTSPTPSSPKEDSHGS